MQWSKLRSLFLDHLAPELQGRVDVHAAAYPSGGRTWITFDGDELVCVQAPGFTHQILRHTTCPAMYGGEILELGDAIFRVVHASIDECLASDNPLVQAIALLDRRCGKRRIESLAAQRADPLPSLQAVLLSVRLVAQKQAPVPIQCECCGEALSYAWRKAKT